MTEGEAPVREGDVLAGKYRVERVLGVGGMGVVVAAWHLQLDERVAIKFLLSDALQNAEAVGRFAREARAAVKIKGEHVARVIDVGTLDSGAPYMVMEYLHGGDLSGLVQARGKIPVDEAVEYVLQASEAIAEAHSIGIVHRDLKPANLFLTRRPDGSSTIKVLDFGISKTMLHGSSSRPEQALTRTTAIMGSPLYMSPEQMASTRDVDGRTDIWALGAILYELLAGAPPFTGETMPQLCAQILQGSPVPLYQARPDIPPPVEAIIMRCLEKDRMRRPASIAEFAVALAPFAPQRAYVSVDRIVKMQRAAGIDTGAGFDPTGISSISANVRGQSQPQLGADSDFGAGGGPRAGGVAPQTMATWADSQSQKRPSHRALYLGLGVAALLAVGAGVLVLRPGPAPSPPVAAAGNAAAPLPGPSADPAANGPLGNAAGAPAVGAPGAAASAPSAAIAANPSAPPAPPQAPTVVEPTPHPQPPALAHGGKKHPASPATPPPAGNPPPKPPGPAPTGSLFDDRK